MRSGYTNYIAAAAAINGDAAAPTVKAGYNVASVARAGAGDYNVTLQRGVDTTVSVLLGCANEGTVTTVAVSQTSDTVFNIIVDDGAPADDDFSLVILSTEGNAPGGALYNDCVAASCRVAAGAAPTFISGDNIASVAKNGDGDFTVTIQQGVDVTTCVPLATTEDGTVRCLVVQLSDTTFQVLTEATDADFSLTVLDLSRVA